MILWYLYQTAHLSNGFVEIICGLKVVPRGFQHTLNILPDNNIYHLYSLESYKTSWTLLLGFTWYMSSLIFGNAALIKWQHCAILQNLQPGCDLNHFWALLENYIFAAIFDKGRSNFAAYIWRLNIETDTYINPNNGGNIFALIAMLMVRVTYHWNCV